MNPQLEFLLSAVYGHGALASTHRADLETSGITEASRVAQGIRSVPCGDCDRLLGFHMSAAVTSIMLLPYPDPAGGYFDMFQVKLFPPLTGTSGQVTKYLQPRTTAPRLYFVRPVLPLVMDAAFPLYLCEGAKKAIAAAQLGLAAVGFAGIHGLHTRGSRRLLADFARIPLTGRTVELVPDGDVSTNPAVGAGAADFAEALDRAGARVQILLLPVAA